MKLCTYRVDQKKYNLQQKLVFLRALDEKVLYRDNLWHYFLDPGGGTLRFQPKFEKKVREFVKKNVRELKVTKRSFYIPTKHEYYGVSYLGDSVLPLFHDLSKLCISFTPQILLGPAMERLNHGLVNMAGLHDFNLEAACYLNLAEGRARIVNAALPLPKRFYSWYFWLVTKLNKVRKVNL